MHKNAKCQETSTKLLKDWNPADKNQGGLTYKGTVYPKISLVPFLHLNCFEVSFLL